MLKNKALQMKLVKINEDDNHPAPVAPSIDPEQINQIAQDQIKNAAIAVGGAVVAIKVVSMFSEIIVHTAKTYIK